MNLAGARWSLAGAEAVIRLRALRASDDFDFYSGFREQEYERKHQSLYADHHVPEIVASASLPQPSRRDTLEIIKQKGES